MDPGTTQCGAGGYLHWQVCLGLDKKGSLPTITGIFGTELHAEISRSAAATSMCGRKTPGSPTPSSSSESVLSSGTIPTIGISSGRWPLPVTLEPSRLKFEFKVIGLCEQSVLTLQSRLEWSELAKFTGVELGLGSHGELGEEAGLDAYVKDPNTKFWCGYRGQGAVVIDEFRGRIDVSHLLRWLDRYPVNVEIKGSSCPLAATAFWITSNVDPRQWYPDLDSETLSALLRRFNITNFL